MFKKLPLTARSISARKRRKFPGTNDADYQTSYSVNGKAYECAYYTRWNRMFTLAVQNDHYICDEWQSFMAFREWMDKQVWVNRHMVRMTTSTDYSPTNCTFVTREIKNLMVLKQGVNQGTYEFTTDRWTAKICRNGKLVHLGSYTTQAEAEAVYRKAKRSHLLKKAQYSSHEPTKQILRELAREV